MVTLLSQAVRGTSKAAPPSSRKNGSGSLAVNAWGTCPLASKATLPAVRFAESWRNVSRRNSGASPSLTSRRAIGPATRCGVTCRITSKTSSGWFRRGSGIVRREKMDNKFDETQKRFSSYKDYPHTLTAILIALSGSGLFPSIDIIYPFSIYPRMAVV